MKKLRKFTLIELLIVIAIIGILLAIALPALFDALERGRATNTASNMKQITTAAIAYSTDDINTGSFPANISALVTWNSDLSTVSTAVDGTAFSFNSANLNTGDSYISVLQGDFAITCSGQAKTTIRRQ